MAASRSGATLVACAWCDRLARYHARRSDGGQSFACPEHVDRCQEARFVSPDPWARAAARANVTYSPRGFLYAPASRGSAVPSRPRVG